MAPVLNRPLRIDQIIASQPELGPAPLDGGYGWIILIACVFIQLTIPSLLACYGVFLLFDQIENLDNEYYLWDHEITLVPITFIAFWTIVDCWCFSIVSSFKCPKLTAFCGTCLICGGSLIIWVAELHEPTIMLFYILAGAVTGIGASLLTQQCEYLIRQYFHIKYKIVKNILYLSYIVGFVFAPLIMGHLIVRHGVLESMIFYQIILVQVFVVGLFFKQPVLTLPPTTEYNLLDSSSCEDEQLVFNKVTVEVQPSTSSKYEDNHPESFETFQKTKKEPKLENGGITQRRHSEIYYDTRDDQNNSSAKNRIRQSFSEEYKNDLSSNTADATIDIEHPRPIIEDENLSFSYENNYAYNSLQQTSGQQSNEENPIDKTTKLVKTIKCDEIVELLKSAMFYRFLLLILIGKLTLLTFWTLYPSIIYNDVSILNVNETINCITFVAIGGLVFTIFWNCLVIPRNKVKLFLSLSFFVASIGFTVINLTSSKNWIIIGGILSTASLSSIQVLTETFILQNTDGINTQTHKLVNFVVGVFIASTIVLDIEYKDCFEVVSLFQFILASLWLSNILYKKIKSMFV